MITDTEPVHTGTLIIPQWDTGHAEFKWDKNDAKDIDLARETFVKYKAKGYMAYRVDPKSGGKGEVLKEFDPKAEQIIMTPPLAGG